MSRSWSRAPPTTNRARLAGPGVEAVLEDAPQAPGDDGPARRPPTPRTAGRPGGRRRLVGGGSAGASQHHHLGDPLGLQDAGPVRGDQPAGEAVVEGEGLAVEVGGEQGVAVGGLARVEGRRAVGARWAPATRPGSCGRVRRRPWPAGRGPARRSRRPSSSSPRRRRWAGWRRGSGRASSWAWSSDRGVATRPPTVEPVVGRAGQVDDAGVAPRPGSPGSPGARRPGRGGPAGPGGAGAGTSGRSW